MNGHANCILAVCCPPHSEGQIDALAHEIEAATGGALSATRTADTTGLAVVVAEWLLKNYDLAPPGSLQPLKDSIRDLAREGYVRADT